MKMNVNAEMLEAIELHFGKESVLTHEEYEAIGASIIADIIQIKQLEHK